MDDSRARLPESNTILGTGSCEEVVDLLVDILGVRQICLATKIVFSAAEKFVSRRIYAASENGKDRVADFIST